MFPWLFDYERCLNFVNFVSQKYVQIFQHAEIKRDFNALTALLDRQLPSLEISPIKLSDCHGGILRFVKLNKSESTLHHNFTDVCAIASEMTLQIVSPRRP